MWPWIPTGEARMMADVWAMEDSRPTSIGDTLQKVYAKTKPEDMVVFDSLPRERIIVQSDKHFADTVESPGFRDNPVPDVTPREPEPEITDADRERARTIAHDRRQQRFKARVTVDGVPEGRLTSIEGGPEHVESLPGFPKTAVLCDGPECPACAAGIPKKMATLPSAELGPRSRERIKQRVKDAYSSKKLSHDDEIVLAHAWLHGSESYPYPAPVRLTDKPGIRLWSNRMGVRQHLWVDLFDANGDYFFGCRFLVAFRESGVLACKGGKILGADTREEILKSVRHPRFGYALSGLVYERYAERDGKLYYRRVDAFQFDPNVWAGFEDALARVRIELRGTRSKRSTRSRVEMADE
jgi:hypothetical protein